VVLPGPVPLVPFSGVLIVYVWGIVKVTALSKAKLSVLYAMWYVPGVFPLRAYILLVRALLVVQRVALLVPPSLRV
jgi:hypothetical protein